MNPVCGVRPWANCITRHRSNLLSCMNEYLAIDNGGYLHGQPSCINGSMAGYFPEKLRRCLIEKLCQRNIALCRDPSTRHLDG